MKLFCILFFLFGCSENKNINNEDILATVGNRTITVSDFIKRSEYNIRPQYCRGKSELDRNIILNSLIAEKLISIDNGGKNNKNLEIIGRKEQKMRELQYNTEVVNNINIEHLSENIYRNASRKFIISYYSFPTQDFAESIKIDIDDGNLLFVEVGPQILQQVEIPSRELVYNAQVNSSLYKNFFSTNIEINKIYGPFNIDGVYIIFRVDNWINNIELSKINRENFIEDIKNISLAFEADIKYRKFINNLLRGKKIIFSADMLNKIKEILSQSLDSDSNKKLEMIKLYKITDDDNINNDILFSLNDSSWSISDFNNLLKKDPINFRTNRENQISLKEIKNIVIEKIENHFLTVNAYQNDLDNDQIIIREKNLWADYYSSVEVINDILNKSSVKLLKSNQIQIMDELLNPLFLKLKDKYHDQIHINYNLLYKIKLSDINMRAQYKEQAYKQIIPLFPVTTNINVLN